MRKLKLSINVRGEPGAGKTKVIRLLEAALKAHYDVKLTSSDHRTDHVDREYCEEYVRFELQEITP